MSEYEELVKTLRLRAELWEKVYGEESVSEKAADAIEELSETVNMQKAQIIAMAGEDKPRWISVDEALPEESEGTVLVCFPNKPPYNLEEPFINAKRDRRVQTGHYSQFSKKWYIGDFCGVGDTDPIAWMPLPEPPQEAQNEL